MSDSEQEEFQFELPESVAEELSIPRTASYSLDHLKVAHLIRVFAKCAEGPGEEEGWIRQQPLWVYLYELIIAGALEEPDYAPASVLLSQDGRSRRMWLNISQEGKALVDELREHRHINGLKLSSSAGQPTTCFQISEQGLRLLQLLPSAARQQVDAELYKGGTVGDPSSLVKVSFDAQNASFHMSSEAGYFFTSTITETEDVSYVSSPYLPACLRGSDKPTNSNAHRRDESAGSSDAIQADTTEVITLGNVRTMICEWVPFGANQIVALNERLGALDRCQGGFFTNMVDDSPTDTNFDVPAGLTSVSILDFDFVRFINFQAEIGYAVSEGIVQIEEFGMHLGVDGSLMYGMFIEAVNERHADSISVDHLARVMVDVHQDSSEIMNDILSEFQMKLLQMIYVGDADNRGKFNVLITESIEPLMEGSCFMDRSERELEIKQVVGDLLKAKLLMGTDLVLLGREGLLLSGPSILECEAIIVSFVFLLAKEQFVRNFFVRMFLLNEQIRHSDTLISSFQEDPNRILEIRTRLQQADQIIIMLQQVLDYLRQSINSHSVPERASLHGRTAQLAEFLDISGHKAQVMLRADDMVKLVNGARNKLVIQGQQSKSITDRLLGDTVNNIDVNFMGLVSAAAADERAAVANDIMNIIFAGSFCFGFLDRMTGDDTLGYQGVDAGPSGVDGYFWRPGTEGVGAVNWIYDMWGWLILDIPLGWFVFNIAWLVGLSILLRRFMAGLLARASGAASKKKILNVPIDMVRFLAYIGTKTLIASDTMVVDGTFIVKTAWHESDPKLWSGGEPPKILIQYDAETAFLLQVIIQWNSQRQKSPADTMLSIFLSELEKCGCLL